MNLSKHLFWDIEFNKLDIEANARFIIERVVSRGDISDWNAIKELYGLAKIKNEVIGIRSMDAKTLSFLSSYFQLSMNSFRCYG